MTPGAEPPFIDRLLAWVPFVASAALVAFALHLALSDPTWALVLGFLAIALFAPSALSRIRMRRLLTSGNVEAILSSWQRSFDRVPHPETMAPLIAATALAAHGFVERSRNTLRRAHRGPAWDAALEHRLVLETLLDAFDGERERALEHAEVLTQLPLPSSPWMRGRVTELRKAIGALARAFAHRSAPSDIGTLRRAARRNPLVFWPMRYAAAVACIDQGARGAARQILDEAPEWPQESVFSAFQAELSNLVAAGEKA